MKGSYVASTSFHSKQRSEFWVNQSDSFLALLPSHLASAFSEKVIDDVLSFEVRIIASVLFAALIGPGGFADQSVDDGNHQYHAADEAWLKQGWPLVQTFCVDCHNADNQEAELDLSTLGDLSTFGQNAGSMKRILEMVRFGAMPPEDADQLSDLERKGLVAALDNKLYQSSCDERPRPGKVSARRLNRAEYNHTIRDLFGIDIQPANDFPSDEVGAGFDNNGDVLSMSPALMEKYFDAAEAVAAAVIQDPTTWPKIRNVIPAEKSFLSGDTVVDSDGGVFMAKDSFGWVDVEVPSSGRYGLVIRGGKSVDGEGRSRIAVYDESGLLLGDFRFRYFGGGNQSKRTERQIKLTKGKHRLYFELEQTGRDDLSVGETISPKFATLDDQIIGAAVDRQKQEQQRLEEIDAANYPFMFRNIELQGPSEHLPDAFSDAHNRVVVASAQKFGDKWRSVPESAAESLRPLLRRAFRTEVTDDDVKPYVDLVVAATDRGENYYQGLRLAVTGILVSPRFLFRIETAPKDWSIEEDNSAALTQHQLATRLSYFLWASTPDAELLDAAAADQLKDAAIEHQVRRMIQDPKADALATQFAAQWLGLRNLEEHEADINQFANFTPSLRHAMKRETELLFMYMVRNNRPITEILTSDFTFANNELASFYGIEGVNQEQFVRVSLTDLPRRGVLSHASVLTLTSNPQRTSPVKRGKWILENVFGTPPPDPPPGVPVLEDTKTADADASFREQLELHRASPACASCHRVMDQLGFGLEQFSPIGGFRQTEHDKPVDASGELPDGRSFNGAVELATILAETESDAFAAAVTERLMTFALGRELSPVDRCTVDDITKNTKVRNYPWIDLILEVVGSRQFQYYELPASNVESSDKLE